MLSADLWLTTLRSGGGFNVTPQKFSGDCDPGSDQLTTVGGWMRLTSESKASGVTFIGRRTPPPRHSTFSSRPNRTRPRQSAFLAKALERQNHPAPRVINTDGHAAYSPAIAQLKREGTLDSGCQHRPVLYLNNVLEQDHRAIKRRINASQHFRSFWGAWRRIAGYEAIHMIRKGQALGSAAGAKVGLLHRFIVGLFAAT